MERSPDFVEAVARGLDVIRAFGTTHRKISLSEVASASGLTRPTARRILITLIELGYVRVEERNFSLTPRILELGVAYVSSSGLWQAARDHLSDLSRATGESCSIAELDGSDIIYVARVAVPKLVALTVSVGTRFPARATSLGKVLLASLTPDDLERALETPSRSGVVPVSQPGNIELIDELRRVRANGWALTDQQLAPAVRSIAAGIRDGDGRTIAAVNVNAHAAETSVDQLVNEHLPLLMRAASAISADRALLESLPNRLVEL